MSIIRSTLLAAAETAAYLISRSVRLRSSATAYFSRTFSGAPTLGTKQTLSILTKRGSLGSALTLLAAGYDGSSANAFYIGFANDNLQVQFGGSVANTLTTSALYRDPSAWYHIVLDIDTTQATAANRVLLFVNGVQITSFSSATYPAQNAVCQFGIANANNKIGAVYTGTNYWYDGYLTEINFIDGQALTPSSFGETDTITGVWKPKRYAGTYGTNGFYLNFSDNSAATAAAIGKDSSGNGNNWTPNNISVTAGATYDSMIDTPTMYDDGGNGRGNYAVLQVTAGLGNGTYSDGNLGFVSGVANQWRSAIASMYQTSGKIYFEATIQTLTGNNLFMIGAVGLQTVNTVVANYAGIVSNGWSVQCNGATGGTKYNAGGSVNVSNASFASWVVGDTLQVAVDVDAGKIWFGRNDVWLEGSPSAGTTPSYSTLSGPIAPAISCYGSGGDKLAVNFGQRPFARTVPTGFKALNAFTLGDSTIKAGNKHFDAVPYTGTGAALKITTGFPVGLSWQKGRSAAQSHFLQDIVRGINAGALVTNSTAAETGAGGVLVASFDSDGVTFNANGNTNTLSNTYASWLWNAGDTTVSNTAGSITSQVRANPTAGISVVTYTGTGANATVGHGLGVAPKMIINKQRNGVNDWPVYHASLTSAAYWLPFDLTNAQINNATVWNSTAPSSSVFSVGTAGVSNTSGGTHVAYCFAEVAGFSKFGSYTGNGAVDGPMIYTGFRPKFVMVKRIDTVGSFWMLDSARDTYNLATKLQRANESLAEETSYASMDFLSNGFKVRVSSTESNANGGTYIYAAFAENPFKYSLAR